jgi:hypothetical protein
VDSRASERDARLLSAVAPDGVCSREYRQRFYRVLTRRNPRARGAETTKQRRIERGEKRRRIPRDWCKGTLFRGFTRASERRRDFERREVR